METCVDMVSNYENGWEEEAYLGCELGGKENVYGVNRKEMEC